MKYVIYSLLLFSLNAFGQDSKEAVTNNFTFNEGIYSTFDELVTNSPKYSNCKLDIVKPLVGYAKFYYFDQNKVRHIYEDSLFSVVDNGVLYIHYKWSFYKSYILGSISILKFTNWYLYANNYAIPKDQLYILDFETGDINSLHLKPVAEILQRDNRLYEEFHADSKREKTENLLKYIFKYNNQHPLYLNQ